MRGDRRAGADEVEIPERVGGIAEQHGAGEPAVAITQLAVGAGAPGRVRTIVLGAGRAVEIAGREHADAGDLEIGGEHASPR